MDNSCFSVDRMWITLGLTYMWYSRACITLVIQNRQTQHIDIFEKVINMLSTSKWHLSTGYQHLTCYVSNVNITSIGKKVNKYEKK